MIAFEPSSLATGLGAVWAADDRWPVLVRIDPATRRGEIFASFPADDRAVDPSRPGWQPGPVAIAVSDEAVWLALPGRSLLFRVDPDSRELRQVGLPFRPAAIGAGPAGVFVIGPPGDGRIAAISPSGAAELTAVGRSLQLVAVSEQLVWTVDDAVHDAVHDTVHDAVHDTVGDAGPTVIALDATSLAPVASFSHLGSPNALVARGGRAWYLGARAAEFRVADGPRQRVVIWSGGPSLDLLELDAASGEAIRLCQPGGSQVALDEDGIWVSGRTDDPMDQPGVRPEIATETDPVASIQRCDLAGNLLTSIRMAGQADEMVVCGGQLWVSGFLRSRQARVLSVLDASGGQAGEADLDGVDITPWYTEPEPEPQYSPREFAQRARAVAEEALTAPPEVRSQFGHRWQEPPLGPSFSLERVGFRSSPGGYALTVLFRWAGEDGLLGFAWQLQQPDDWPTTPAQAGQAVCTYLEENLKHSGHGLATAVREPRHGVIWLRWA